MTRNNLVRVHFGVNWNQLFIGSIFSLNCMLCIAVSWLSWELSARHYMSDLFLGWMLYKATKPVLDWFCLVYWCMFIFVVLVSSVPY